ncbi:MAG TPA: molybdenum cofactor biosynthesis protein MoaE [Thalassobaculum sp.]
MAVRVQEQDFDLGAELAALTAGNHRIGGLGVFVGVVRDIAGGATVADMTLEHYPGMTERQLEAIEAAARARWPLEASLIVHRIGRLEPGDNIVLVACASAHRQAALDATAFLIDWLKTRAPFWKLERTPDGEHWVDARESDETAVARWGG